MQHGNGLGEIQAYHDWCDEQPTVVDAAPDLRCNVVPHHVEVDGRTQFLLGLLAGGVWFYAILRAFGG